MQDRYANPGTPVWRTQPNGTSLIRQEGDFIFLSGSGASSTGDRPFLDRFNLKTLKAERLFRSGKTESERFLAFSGKDDGRDVDALSPTLRAMNHAEGHANGGGQVAIAEERACGFIVRRLTPLECERLQGFPDGWTEGQSDAKRYHQLGNAVCVNVMEWLGQRLVRVCGE